MGTIENLNIWKKAIELTSEIYKLTQQSKKLSSDFGLKDQIQRSSVSVASNIAEGNDRETDSEFTRYLYIARGSLGELKTQIIIAKEIGYITQIEFDKILEKIEELHKMINSFIKTIKK